MFSFDVLVLLMTALAAVVAREGAVVGVDGMVGEVVMLGAVAAEVDFLMLASVEAGLEAASAVVGAGGSASSATFDVDARAELEFKSTA